MRIDEYWRETLVARIEKFAEMKGISPVTAGEVLIGNSRLYQSIIRGGDILTDTHLKLDRLLKEQTKKLMRKRSK